MRLTKSIAQNVPLGFGVGIEVFDNSVRFYTYDKETGSDIDAVVYDFAAPPLGLKELNTRNNIYVAANADGEIEPLYNKMAVSGLTKDSGYKHIVKKGKPVIGQIYIPFADSTIDECAARITYTPEVGYKSNIEITEEVQDYGAFFNEVSPSLTAQVSNGIITTQLVDGFGSPLAKAGVKVYAKTDGGYLVFSERVTDVSGAAKFKLLTTGFEPGDEATVEFGFKFVSNLAHVKVAA